MSLASNNTVIKRFTYDWLIRFAELHPIEIYNAAYSSNDQHPYDPLKSKYASISPFFTTIFSRYMPYIFQTPDVFVENGKIEVAEDDSPPDYKTKVYACDTLDFSNLEPGTISLLKNNRIFFYYSKTLLMYQKFYDSNARNHFTADEFKHVLKSCPLGETFHGFATFDKPTPFSEIWPLLAHYKEIRMGMINLIYDENVANVMSKCHVVPNIVDLRDLNISDKAILEMFEYFASLPQCPYELAFDFLKPKPESLFDAVLEKFVSAGYRVKNSRNPETPFKTIELRVENYEFIICCSNNV